MHDEHTPPTPGPRLPVRIGALSLACAVGAATLLIGGTAGASAPKKNYHAGSDTATFAVTGILDRNCLVSTGGDTVYIKPGDDIDFKTSLAGVDVSGIASSLSSLTSHLTGSDIAGLNVDAVLDARAKHPTKFTVKGGQTFTLKGLSKGTHTLNWTATSVRLAPGLLGGRGDVALSSSKLKSGAKLSWAGHAYVTSGAPDCRLAVATPKVDASAGPVHVSIPGVKVKTPVDPKKVVSNLNKAVKKVTAKPAATKPQTKTKAKPATTNTNNGTTPAGQDGLLPVPARVVPDGYGSSSYGGGGGFYGSSVTGSSGTSGFAPLTLTRPDGSKTSVGGSATSNDSTTPAAKKASASNSAAAAQLPVVLAIIAIIALALVASTYARLFLLRRNAA